MLSKVLITLSNANLAPLGKFNQIFSHSHPIVSAGIVVSFIQSRFKVISFDGAINANIPREKKSLNEGMACRKFINTVCVLGADSLC